MPRTSKINRKAIFKQMRELLSTWESTFPMGKPIEFTGHQFQAFIEVYVPDHDSRLNARFLRGHGYEQLSEKQWVKPLPALGKQLEIG